MDLPGIHAAANLASERGQRQYLALSGIRLGALMAAAALGALSFVRDTWPGIGWLIVIAFVAAFASEVILIAEQPERDWYAGRAIAESTKTLAWRYAVGAAPFSSNLSQSEADKLLNSRIAEVVSTAKDRLDLHGKQPTITASMKALRSAQLEVRRSVYIQNRTREQQQWYSNKGKLNARRASIGRWAMVLCEILAITAAVAAVGSDLLVDLAGILAAFVASLAAWVATKQFSQLASAYRVAAVELALQEDVLTRVSVEEWTNAVANAEEAISREHTMWLASRGIEKTL